MRYFTAVLLTATILIAGCGGKSDDPPSGRGIAVFVPGLLEGSPTYEMMDSGVRKAAKPEGYDVKTIEGGFDQAGWEDQLMVLASEGQYALIVTSNPAMPEIARRVVDAFPDQPILVLDGPGVPDDTIMTLDYDHREQAFLIGYFAGLATASEELEGTNSERKVGLIVGQEYPQMNREIRPGFEIGLHTAHPDSSLEFRVLGNWYDADKARELANGLFDQGVDLILTIAGSANQGVVAAAERAGKYVLWFDSDGLETAPGTVLAAAVVRQEQAAEELTASWIGGTLEAGDSLRVGVAEGYVDFIDESRLYKKHVPQGLRDEMALFLGKMRAGTMSLRAAEFDG